MEEEKWYTLTQAGLSIGKSSFYFRNILKKHPEYFDGVILKEVSNAKIIRESDIPKVLQHVKKEGDRLRKTVLNAVCKAKKAPLLLTP